MASCAFAGCGGSVTALDEIDKAVRVFVSDLDACDAFTGSLENIELGNEDYVKTALEWIQGSRDASDRLLADVEILRGMTYKGKTAQLGAAVGELCGGAMEAVEELRLMLDGVEDILEAAEPALVMQIDIPLGMLKELAEILRRLEEVTAAADRSLQAIEAVEVPEVLSGYKAFFIELTTAIKEAAQESISLLKNGAADPKKGGGESSAKVNRLISLYPALAYETFSALKINKLDPVVERVELEINRLFLGE